MKTFQSCQQNTCLTGARRKAKQELRALRVSVVKKWTVTPFLVFRQIIRWGFHTLENLYDFFSGKFYEIGDDRIQPNAWHFLALMLVVAFLFLLVCVGMLAIQMIALGPVILDGKLK